MNPSILVITCICTVLLFALVLPVSADDASTVTVTPIATITSTPAPGFDPLGSLESILGLRHEDRNLTQDISANDQDIHQNWWDNLNIFQDILGNRATVREDQSTDLANRSANLGYREDIHTDRQDIRNDSGNQTDEEQQIAATGPISTRIGRAMSQPMRIFMMNGMQAERTPPKSTQIIRRTGLPPAE